MVGSGVNIPLNHPDWFKCLEQNLQNTNLGPRTIADLIDHSRGVWKCDLFKKLYPQPQCDEILRIPISKTRVILDKLLWKHSSSKEYSVKTAYKLLLKEHIQASHTQLKPCQNPPKVWNLIWKVNVPHKVRLLCGSLSMTASLPYSPWKTKVFLLTTHALCARKKRNLLPTCSCWKNWFCISYKTHSGSNTRIYFIHKR